MNDIHLTPPELAARWHVSKFYLQKQRTAGTGPMYMKFGPRKVLYPLADIEIWEASRRTASTATAA